MNKNMNKEGVRGNYVSSYIISLTSATATTINGTLLSDANFEFRGLLHDEPNITNRQISIISAQIPVSFYNINEYNNVFSFKIDVLGAFVYNIPNGNYNANSLCTLLNTFFADVQLNPNVTANINKTTGKIQFKYLNPTDDPTLSLLFRKESTCQEIFGFGLGVDYSGTQIYVAGGNSYVELNGIYPMNLLGPKVLSIKSPSLNTTNFSSIYKGANTLLATIPVDAPLFGQIDYHNYADLKTTFSNTELNNLEIQIFDEKNNLIDFNGTNWSITVAIHITKGDSPLPKVASPLQGLSETTVGPLGENTKKGGKAPSIEDQILFS